MHRLCIPCLLFALLCLPLFAQEETGDAAKEGAQGSPFNQSKFVPDISFVLDTSYLHRNRGNETYEKQETPGFAPSQSDEVSHGHRLYDNSPRGFRFNYGELALYSVVDPYLELFAVIQFTQAGVTVEEAYFTTTSLPFGFQVRAGKFLSGIGRINEQHEHYWDFYGAPLVYEAFFSDSLNEVGARLTWVAPLDFYLMFGAEFFEGKNAASFGHEGFADQNGNPLEHDAAGPNLGTLYTKTSFDLDDLTVYLGSSAAFGRARLNHGIDVKDVAGSAVTGDTVIVAGDMTLKYLFDSVRFLALQAEYLYRAMDGTLYEKDAAGTITGYDLDRRQSGLYAQLVTRFAMRWRAGVRYDLLAQNREERNGERRPLPSNMARYSCMAEFNPTEFSRFRLQYNYDRSRYLAESGEYQACPNHEIILQANITIGAHGAHSF